MTMKKTCIIGGRIDGENRVEHYIDKTGREVK